MIKPGLDSGMDSGLNSGLCFLHNMSNLFTTRFDRVSLVNWIHIPRSTQHIILRSNNGNQLRASFNLSTEWQDKVDYTKSATVKKAMYSLEYVASRCNKKYPRLSLIIYSPEHHNCVEFAACLSRAWLWLNFLIITF